MAQGTVTTARGDSLNFDELKNQANLPIALAKQTKKTINKHKFSKRPPLNVRGFQPAQGKAPAPEMPEEVQKAVEYIEASDGSRTIAHDTIPPASSVNPTGKAETLSDITGVKVKPTPEAIERQKARMGTGNDDIEAASDEVLGDILSELEVPEDDDGDKTATRRTRKKAAE